MTRIMISYLAVKCRAHVFAPQHIDQEVGQLVSPLAQSGRTVMPSRIVVKQFGILALDHRSTRTRRNNHGIHCHPLKDFNRMTCNVLSVTRVPAIKEWLPATGLILREFNLNSQTAKQADSRNTHLGPEDIPQTRYHQ